MDYAALGRLPVPGDNPAGTDCRYDAPFETLQAEIDKLSSPTADGKMDWGKIIQLAADILAHQSKDLTVASYLAVGLVRERRLEGLDEGIQVFKDLVENFWDSLYPPKKRMRGRSGAFTWWMEKTEAVLEGLNPDPIPADRAQRLLDNLRAIDDFLADKMPEPPLLRPLQRQIERMPVQEAPAPAEPEPRPAAGAPPEATSPTAAETAPAVPVAPAAVPKPAPATAAPSPQPAPPTAAEAPGEVTTEQDAGKSIDAGIQHIRQASYLLFQQDSKNPSAYRYRRMAAWARIEELPPHQDGVTQIPPPPPQVSDTLTELRDAANWPALIETIEQRVSQFVFWFDLHFMAAEALNSLGPAYKAALDAVCRETAYCLQRLPGMENLAFSNEMPFSDPQTREWLSTIAMGASGGANAGAGYGGDSQERVNRLTQDALGLARNKKVAEAVEVLYHELRNAPSRSEQTRWRLAIVRVLMAAKKGAAALPHLDQVVADINLFKLEQWDPGLALEGLTLAWKGYTPQNDKTLQSQATELLGRIARLDPVAALKLAP